jgi:hypothetical protein
METFTQIHAAGRWVASLVVNPLLRRTDRVEALATFVALVVSLVAILVVGE